MTRIIAGRWGGRRLLTPKGAGTRPTSDRVREALFSRLQALIELDGARVLDLYAGSGALGLEALSRGAGHLVAVEAHRSTAGLIERNVATLEAAGRAVVHTAKVETFLRGEPGRGGAFDLILLDPPYPLSEPEVAGVLDLLLQHDWATPEALVVVERSSRSPEPTWPAGLEPLKVRRYGETSVHFAERIRGAEGRIEG